MPTNSDTFNESLNMALENFTSSTAFSVAEPSSNTFTAEEQAKIDRFCAANGSDVQAIDVKGETLLHKIGYVDAAIVRFLVSKGADVNAKDKNGKTPLHVAAKSSTNVEVVQFLVSKGANVNTKDYAGETPLTAATDLILNDEIAKFLVSQGADVNVKDSNGETALHRAILLARIDAIEFFVSIGADVNVKDDKGQTPLHVLVQACSNPVIAKSGVNIAKLFIANGADVNAIDSLGGTPLDYAGVLATHYGNAAMFKYLSNPSAASVNRSTSNTGSGCASTVAVCVIVTLFYLLFAIVG